MKSLHWLKDVLQLSVIRRPEAPLTNTHLLNIVKMAIRAEEETVAKAEVAMNEAMGDDKKWGS